MKNLNNIPSGKKVYFASDFHLGAPDNKSSLEREKKIIKWLEHIQDDAHAIFLLGDIFDFWFEYKHVIPKGSIRIQGKFAELADAGIPLHFFTGNHDMWMFDYFKSQFDVEIHRKPISIELDSKTFMLGHGDGLGPKDKFYKFLKAFFHNKACQRLFGFLHPYIGMGIAQKWSRSSRLSHGEEDSVFLGDDEWIYQYCQDVEKKTHHDFYIFGHRHLPIDQKVSDSSRYINLGEWMNYQTYATFDGQNTELLTFDA